MNKEITMKTKIFASYYDFLCRTNKKMNGVSKAFAKEHPNYEQDNESNIRCWNCISCENCIGCEGCEGCEDCEGCSCCEDCEGCDDCVNCKACVNCEEYRDCVELQN